jgi:hypothetical protein
LYNKPYIGVNYLKNMEDLTEKVAEFSPSEVDQQASEPKSEAYEGLKVVEDRPYTGGTSIRYWM